MRWLCGGSPLRLNRCAGLKGRFERKIERFLRPSVQTLWVLACLQHRMITGCHHGVETWIVLLISSGTISDIWAQLLDVSDVRSTQLQNIAGRVLGVPILHDLDRASTKGQPTVALFEGAGRGMASK